MVDTLCLVQRLNKVVSVDSWHQCDHEYLTPRTAATLAKGENTIKTTYRQTIET